MLDVYTSYARLVIELAPQYFLLGFEDFCILKYETDYLPSDNEIYGNITWECRPHSDLYPFIYTAILLNYGFESVLKFSDVWLRRENGEATQQYINRLEVFKIASITEFVTLPLLVAAIFYIYSIRDGKSDLSDIPKILVCIPFVLSVIAGIIMSCAFGIVVYDLRAEMASVEAELGMFGISMSFGSIFFSFLLLSFVFIALTMLLWIMPMWCSNSNNSNETSRESNFLQP